MSDSTAGDLVIFALITLVVFALQPATIIWARNACSPARQRSAATRRQEVFFYMYAAKPGLGFALDTAEVIVSIISIVFVVVETFDVSRAHHIDLLSQATPNLCSGSQSLPRIHGDRIRNNVCCRLCTPSVPSSR